MYLPLNRVNSKMLAIILIAAGVILMPDIISPTGTDIINLTFSKFMSVNYGWDYAETVMLTFMAGFLLVFAGMLIYPYNTKRLLIGRLRFAVGYLIARPYMIVLAVIMLILMYYFIDQFYASIENYAASLIDGLV